jgi:3-isopropylmalate/(R)-2-methylmalate dehydratase small subunit
VCQRLAAAAEDDPATVVRIDLPAQTVSGPGVEAEFAIDPHTKRCLVEGLDDIGITLGHEDAIAAFEARRPAWLPSSRA